MEDLWCIGGDFNSVLTLEDTRGSPNLAQDTRRYNDRIRNCELKDLGYSGQPFTWQRSNIRRRLDRMFSNSLWLNMFTEACVIHLPKLKSDHVPILLKLNHNQESLIGCHPFRFLAPWIVHDDYNNMVTSCWRRNEDLLKNIATFTDQAKGWNKEVFGHIFRKKIEFF